MSKSDCLIYNHDDKVISEWIVSQEEISYELAPVSINEKLLKGSWLEKESENYQRKTTKAK
jgi:hypothetical protein